MKLPENFPSHFPKSKKEESEFGKGRKDILICKKCNAVYFYKSWHRRLEDYPELKETKGLKFVLCPSGQMIKDKKFEGEIILENVPEKIKAELKNLVLNFGEKASKRDSQHRVISFKEQGKNIRILTTENQLAQRIAKKIKETFKGELSLSYSKKESIVRARVTF